MSTVTRRRRRPILITTRRKRRRYRAPVTRGVLFGPALGLPLWGWADLGWEHLARPLAWGTLGVMLVASLLIVPAAALLVAFLPSAWGLLVPCSWRKAHRARHGRENCRSAYIPAFLRRLIFRTDRWQCVCCGSAINLQVDHVFPWSLGGLTVFFNLVTLCAVCNRTKSNYWFFRRSGRSVYVPFAGAGDRSRAAYILAYEKSHRWRPLRLLRAAWALN